MRVPRASFHRVLPAPTGSRERVPASPCNAACTRGTDVTGPAGRPLKPAAARAVPAEGRKPVSTGGEAAMAAEALAVRGAIPRRPVTHGDWLNCFDCDTATNTPEPARPLVARPALETMPFS